MIKNFIVLSALLAVNTVEGKLNGPLVGSSNDVYYDLDFLASLGDSSAISLKPGMRVIFDWKEDEENSFEQWDIIENSCESALRVIYDDYQAPLMFAFDDSF